MKSRPNASFRLPQEEDADSRHGRDEDKVVLCSLRRRVVAQDSGIVFLRVLEALELFVDVTGNGRQLATFYVGNDIDIALHAVVADHAGRRYDANLGHIAQSHSQAARRIDHEIGNAANAVTSLGRAPYDHVENSLVLIECTDLN